MRPGEPKSFQVVGKGRSFEVEIDYVYRHIPERDWAVRHLRLRLIATWRPDLKCHRLYVTNTTKRQLLAQIAPAVYALRWEIELLFREMKQTLCTEDMPSANRATTECLLYASLLALALGRKLHRVLCHCPSTQSRLANRHCPQERWTEPFRCAAPALLDLLLAPLKLRRTIESRILTLLQREAPDPNSARLLLPDRARSGVLGVDLAAA